MKPIQPQPAEWIDTAPIHVSVAKDMAATPEEVFAVLADHESWPTWFEGLKSVEVTGKAAGVGAERMVDVPQMGMVEEEFNVWEPNQRFGFTVVAMARPSLNTLNELITLEPSTYGTLVTYQQGFDPKKVAAPAIKIAAKRRIPGVLLAALAGLEREAVARRPAG